MCIIPSRTDRSAYRRRMGWLGPGRCGPAGLAAIYALRPVRWQPPSVDAVIAVPRNGTMHHWTLHRHCTLHVLLAFSALTRLDTSRPNPGVTSIYVVSDTVCVFVLTLTRTPPDPDPNCPSCIKGSPSLWSVRHGCFDTLAGPVYVLHAHRLSVIPFLLLLCHRRPHRKR